MSYTHDRDQFISLGAKEGLSLDTCRKLLRYATTLQRLQEAQCNGDYPYNGDRDKHAHGNGPIPGGKQSWYESYYTQCPKCEASGVARSAMRTSNFLFGCSSCSAPIAADVPALLDADCNCGGTATAKKHKKVRVCPDCRTQELVQATLACVASGCACGTEDKFKAHFNGDPRGAVLVLETPGHPWSEDGRGRGLYVPAR